MGSVREVGKGLRMCSRNLAVAAIVAACTAEMIREGTCAHGPREGWRTEPRGGQEDNFRETSVRPQNSDCAPKPLFSLSLGSLLLLHTGKDIEHGSLSASGTWCVWGLGWLKKSGLE